MLKAFEQLAKQTLSKNMKKFRYFLIVGVLILLFLSLSFITSLPASASIDDDFQKETLSQRAKADIKADAILALPNIASFTDIKSDSTVSILSITKIDGGIEVLARGWLNNIQYGFSDDGSVDIEKFRIYNPPILVYDPNGKIVRESKDDKGIITKRYLTENPAEAIKQVLGHAVLITGKLGYKITPEKIGHTTDIFYPAGGANSPVDGPIFMEIPTGGNWATMIAAAGSEALPTTTGTRFIGYEMWPSSLLYDIFWRSIFLFNTATINTDTINSAVISLYGTNKYNEANSSPDINIYSSAPAADNDLVPGDFDSFGSTAFSSAISYASFNTSGYNDFTLNASGISNINKTGISKFGARNANHDVAGSVPDWVSEGYDRLEGYYADQTGTASDPVLTIVHTAETPPPPPTATSTPTDNIEYIYYHATSSVAGVDTVINGYYIVPFFLYLIPFTTFLFTLLLMCGIYWLITNKRK